MQNDRVFEHHMLQEIHEQPRAVGDTIAEHLSEYPRGSNARLEAERIATPYP